MRNIDNNKKHIFKVILGFVLITVFMYSQINAQENGKKEVELFPSGPMESVPFGAYSTRLTYTPEWDGPWPVSEVADVVVRFDNEEPRFVFWRGTSYIPCWATYDGAWFTNEFFERRGGPVSGTVSMVEPMSDKQTRYSNVRIIENNDARVIVHWRYAPTDLEYSMAFPDEETNWGDWADEYYILYPDAVGIRKATLFTSALDEWIEYQESIVINQPGTFPDDNIHDGAVILLNLEGDAKTYLWTEKGAPRFEDVPEKFRIQKINLKSDYKPFTVINQENAVVGPYVGHAPGSRFNFWDHWPVSHTKSDTRVAESAERPSHTSLTHIKWNPSSETDKSRTWIMMHGMSNSDDDDLVQLAASWIHPAELRLFAGNFKVEGYDKSQRAYVLTALNGAGTLSFKLLAERESPVANPAFLIKDWGNSPVKLKLNEQFIERGEQFRSGYISNVNGTDLIVWLKLKSDEPVKILLYK